MIDTLGQPPGIEVYNNGICDTNEFKLASMTVDCITSNEKKRYDTKAMVYIRYSGEVFFQSVFASERETRDNQFKAWIPTGGERISLTPNSYPAQIKVKIKSPTNSQVQEKVWDMKFYGIDHAHIYRWEDTPGDLTEKHLQIRVHYD